MPSRAHFLTYSPLLPSGTAAFPEVILRLRGTAVTCMSISDVVFSDTGDFFAVSRYRIRARVNHPQTNGKLGKFHGELQRKLPRFIGASAGKGVDVVVNPAARDSHAPCYADCCGVAYMTGEKPVQTVCSTS